MGIYLSTIAPSLSLQYFLEASVLLLAGGTELRGMGGVPIDLKYREGASKSKHLLYGQVPSYVLPWSDWIIRAPAGGSKSGRSVSTLNRDKYNRFTCLMK